MTENQASKDSREPTFFDVLDRDPIEELLTPDQIFQNDDPDLFCRLREDNRFDRKSAKIPPKEIAKYLSAFGNGPSTDGGVLVIGIEDSGEISGFAGINPEKIPELEACGSDSCPDGRFEVRRVAVTNKKGQKDFILLIRVKYVEGKLVCLSNGDAYERIADQKRKLPEEKKQEIKIDKGERSFELEPCSLMYPEDFNVSAINSFASKVKLNAESEMNYSAADVLKSFNLARERSGTLVCNNACAILFADNPVTLFPGLVVHFLKYNGNEERSGKEYNVIKDRMISGSLTEIIKEAAAMIDNNIREFTEFRDGKFMAVPEYPRDAWYEMLVNACVHRSYNIKNAPIFVRMFDDRLEVESPGGFMPQITPDTIVGTHRPRNPFVMRALRETGEVRCISEGTRRMVAEMQAAKLPPPEFSQKNRDNLSVICTLRNNVTDRSNSLDSDAYNRLGEVVAFGLSSEEKKIVNYLFEHGKVNVSDALRILKTTRWHTAKSLLSGLEERGILEFVSRGVPRDAHAHYILASKN